MCTPRRTTQRTTRATAAAALAPLDPSLTAARAALERANLLPLGGRVGDTFLLGVRPTSATVEVLHPASAPAFSYTLPLRADNVKVFWAGSGRQPRALDRSAAGFHHLGDVTLKVRPLKDSAHGVGAYRRYSTVADDWRRREDGPDVRQAASRASVTPNGLGLNATDALHPPDGPLHLWREVARVRPMYVGAGARFSMCRLTVHGPRGTALS